MRRLLIPALLLLAIRARGDCAAVYPPSSYSLEFRAPRCDASAPCVQGKAIHFSVAPATSCYIPFYPGPCPPPYVIDSCDTLTWNFGDGTAAQVVHGSGEADHIFPKAGDFAIQVEVRNSAGPTSIHGSAYVCADPPAFVRFTKQTYEVSEKGGSVTVTLERSGDTQRAFTLDYGTTPNWPPGTFVRNLEALTMKVSFASGETVKQIVHRVQDDNVFTGDSDHSIGVLSDGAAVMSYGPVTTATIHITEDEPGPEFTIDDVTIPEGDREQVINFHLHLSQPATDRVYAWCLPHDGTARAGVDFLMSGTSVIFEPGQTTATCPVHVFGNSTPEPDKTFTVTTDPFGPMIVKKGTALCTLVNDDVVAPPRTEPPPPPQQSLAFAPPAVRITAGANGTATLQAAVPASVALTSSDPAVVQVDPLMVAPGVVSLRALKAGTATITASDSSAAASLSVVVLPPPRRRPAH